jgi:hypothetical protein
LDYHIASGHHYYSVPHRYIGATVDVRLSASTVEIFHKGQRLATHLTSERRGGFSTIPEHRPAHHQAVVDLTHERLLKQAAVIGPHVVAVLRAQAVRRGHPDQVIRSAQGILRLATDFSPAALDVACERALQLHSYSYRSVRQLLQLPTTAPSTPRATHPSASASPSPSFPSITTTSHENVRGAAYYQQESLVC